MEAEPHVVCGTRLASLLCKARVGARQKFKK